MGQQVLLEIRRNGESLPVVPVEDLESKKVQRFVRLAGAVVHVITPRLGLMLFYAGPGVYLPYAAAGSSFSRVGRRGRSGNAKVVVLELDGQPIADLDDFIAASTAPRDGHLPTWSSGTSTCLTHHPLPRA